MILCRYRNDGFIPRGHLIRIDPDHIYKGGYHIKKSEDGYTSVPPDSMVIYGYVSVGQLQYLDSGFYHECATAWEEL